MTGCTNIADMNPIYCETWKLTITIVNTCVNDALSNIASTFTDYTYYMGEDTDSPNFWYAYAPPAKTHTSFTAAWSSSIDGSVVSNRFEGCPGTFELLRD